MKRDIATWLEARRVDVSDVTEADVVGNVHAMTEVRSLVGRLAAPERMRAIGATMPRCVLMSGPPGTGKTLLARLIVSLVGRLSRPVDLYEVSADELSPERIRAIFRHLARTSAERPAVIYIDEIDLIARARGSRDLDPEARRSLTALLAGLDGLHSAGDVMVLASTNLTPAGLDAAVRRPGRIDVTIFVTWPDDDGIADLWRHYLARVRCEGEIDIPDLVRRTSGDTPAEIRAWVLDAAALAIADGREAVTPADIDASLARHGRVVPAVEVAPVSHEAAIHEAGHVCVAEVLRPGWVRSVRASSYSGFTDIDRSGVVITDARMRDEAVVAYGGMAAQELLGEPGSGGHNDIVAATGVLMERWHSGLDRSLPPVHEEALGDLLSAELKAAVTAAIAAEATAARERAERIVAVNGPALQRLALRLQAAGTLEGEELRDAIAAAGFRSPDDDLPVLPIDAPAIGAATA